VQEVGAGHLAVLSGSGSSLELVSASRQALAMYAGDEAEAAALPPDWQRLYADRDLRVSGCNTLGVVGLEDMGHRVCVCVCACVRACGCVRVRVRACLRARARA
jgi:hypothetical protein